MNERYRYGYGDEPGERDRTFSRQGSMTEQRDVDQAGRGDEEDEDRLADRIREADSEPGAAATETTPRDEPADRDEADSTSSNSVFDVEDEVTGEAGTAEPASDTEERPPIALGPPSRTTDEAPAAATAAAEPVEAEETAGTAKPEAVTARAGTPTDETPAAVSTGVESPEPDPARDGAPGTETEMIVPGSGPAPVAASASERSALLGSIDGHAARARFLDIQAGFVDEPRQAVQEAERFVDELVQGLVRALESERATLRASIEGGSTEDLRIALRGYRAFVDRLLNLTV